MRTISKVALAVATALTSGVVFALPPSTVYSSSDVRLIVGGSSAFRDSFKQEVPSLCADTMDTYAATGGPDFKAYTCTMNSVAGASFAGKKLVVFYRSEGGSVWGVGPLAKNIAVAHLGLARTNTSSPLFGACTGASPSYSCAITGWNLNTDSATSGPLASEKIMLGVSDVEPAQFVGENWVDSTSGAGKLGAASPNQTQLNTITTINAAIGQAFGVYVNSGVGASPMTISKQSLTSITAGLYADWNQVPNAAGTGFVSAGSLPIVLCKRDAGSGTQTAASLFFNGMNCSTAPYTFAGSSVARNNSTGAELTCVSSNPGGIGFASIQSSLPAGTSIVAIDGVVPSRVNAANGTYGFSYEVTFNSGAELAANANENAVAQVLIGRMENSATIPASPNNSAFALPTGSNVLSLPVSSSNPVALATRGGLGCAAPIGQN